MERTFFTVAARHWPKGDRLPVIDWRRLTPIKTREQQSVTVCIYMAFPPENKPVKDDDFGRTWLPGDAIPVPEAEYKGADSGWALWNEVAQQHERKFAPTAPMGANSMDPHDVGWAATEPAPVIADERGRHPLH